MCLLAVPMDARTCHFHRTVGYLENGCWKIRISSRMMMVMRRMMMVMMMMLMMIKVMMTRHCEGAAAWRDSPGIWREFPLRGERGGSLSPGRSGIRGPTRPFASQSKTQGSPLGGYLSWHTYTKLTATQNARSNVRQNAKSNARQNAIRLCQISMPDNMSGHIWQIECQNPPACRRVWLWGVVLVSVLVLYLFLFLACTCSFLLSRDFLLRVNQSPPPCFCFDLRPMRVHAWVLSTFICAPQGSRGI